jgi:hypothetical protein
VAQEAVGSKPTSRPRRGVAQFGSALAWGARGRWFESSRPDHEKPLVRVDEGFFLSHWFPIASGVNAIVHSLGKSLEVSQVLFKLGFRVGEEFLSDVPQ